MENSSNYIIIIGVLALLALLMYIRRGRTKGKKLSPLAAVIFSENPLIRYSLMGLGILIAFIDILRKAGPDS